MAALFLALNPASATDYFVDPSGGNAYATVQEAVDAVAGQTESRRANIFIAPGTYHEVVTVNKPYISFIGMGVTPDATTIAFASAVEFGDPFSWGSVIEIQSGATGSTGIGVLEIYNLGL